MSSKRRADLPGQKRAARPRKRRGNDRRIHVKRQLARGIVNAAKHVYGHKTLLHSPSVRRINIQAPLQPMSRGALKFLGSRKRNQKEKKRNTESERENDGKRRNSTERVRGGGGGQKGRRRRRNLSCSLVEAQLSESLQLHAKVIAHGDRRFLSSHLAQRNPSPPGLFNLFVLLLASTIADRPQKLSHRRSGFFRST